MNERDLVPLDAGEVRRTPASGGDRLMLLLAGLALAGGLAIAVGNLLPPPEDEVAQASGSAAPTSQVTRTPRPTPTEEPLRQIVLTPDDPPESGIPYAWNQEWIRALVDLPIRAAISASGAIDTLAAGAVALAEQSDRRNSEPGWLYLVDGATRGWVQVDDGANLLVERYPVDRGSWTHTSVEWQAGDTGFFAQAADGTIATSPTGAGWVRYEAPRLAKGPAPGWAMAWGPSGWIAPSFDGGSSRLSGAFLWQSDDGRGWNPLGRMSIGSRGFDLYGLWGSSMGYLAWGSPPESRDSFWFSTNGLAWLEMPQAGLSTEAWIQVVSTPQGFYVFDGQDSRRATTPLGVFTGDGATWLPVRDGPRSERAWIASLGGWLIAVDRDQDTYATRIWIGGPRQDGWAWEDTDVGATFDGIVPAVLTGDGDRVVMVGWERATEIVRSWASLDGVTWTPLAPPPGGFGVIPHQALGGASGILVLGVARDDGREAAQPWRLVGDGWRPVDLARALGIDYLAATSCPPPPTTALEFLTLDVGTSVHCFGDRPISFRAYSMPCNGCGGGSDATFSPSWMTPGESPIFLSPIETEDAPWIDLALDPSVERSNAWAGQWVEVVGHYDDPVAVECRQQVSREEEPWYPGRQQLIEDCRRRFVITEVTVVDGP